MTVHTTLNEIKKHSPCGSLWIKLLKSLGKTSADDEPLEFRTIYEALGADDMLWCAVALDKRSRVYLGAKFAETALRNTDDKRVHDCVRVCFLYAEGKATDEELSAARYEELSAAWSAARYAAWSAEWTAARSAAGGAAWYAACDAAWGAARDAARSAACGAARSAAMESFAQMMLKYVEQE